MKLLSLDLCRVYPLKKSYNEPKGLWLWNSLANNPVFLHSFGDIGRDWWENYERNASSQFSVQFHSGNKEKKHNKIIHNQVKTLKRYNCLLPLAII